MIPKQKERQEALRLFEAYRAAYQAWNEYEEKVQHENWEVLYCSETGVPLLASDETIEETFRSLVLQTQEEAA